MAVEVKWDGGGISAFFKSDDVAGALGERASAIASEVNGEIDALLGNRGNGLKNPHAVGRSRVLSKTAIGVVYTANPAANALVSKNPEILRKHTTTK